MPAQLIYDGDKVNFPKSMRQPNADQFQGTEPEKLVELACRICYDSVGRGRSSDKLHQHILEVKHLSVVEHVTFTVTLPIFNEFNLLMALVNRKGIWISHNGYRFEVTANLRAIIEWDKYLIDQDNNINSCIRDILATFANQLCPQIIKMPRQVSLTGSRLKDRDQLSEDQAHISLWLQGSRAFSHEQVRHRFAVSQRSTRYCDETHSEYVTHPLIKQFFDDANVNHERKQYIKATIAQSKSYDKQSYDIICEYLQWYLTNKSVDSLTARKQARGAAARYLAHALATEMIFTAPVSGWKHILEMRCSDAADAEIRVIYNDVLDALKQSHYGHHFEQYKLSPAQDGIENVLN